MAKSIRLELGDNILRSLGLSSTTVTIGQQSNHISVKKCKIRAITPFKLTEVGFN